MRPSYARRRPRDDLATVSARSQASPALCPSEPRPPRGEMKAVPYDARSDTRPPALNLDLVNHALSEKVIPDWMFSFKPKQPLHLGHVWQKKHQPTQTISLASGRAPAGAARDGLIHSLCTPAPVPAAKSGAETPSESPARRAHNYNDNGDDGDNNARLKPTTTTTTTTATTTTFYFTYTYYATVCWRCCIPVSHRRLLTLWQPSYNVAVLQGAIL